jgi:hypothetical protein
MGSVLLDGSHRDDDRMMFFEERLEFGVCEFAKENSRRFHASAAAGRA